MNGAQNPTTVWKFIVPFNRTGVEMSVGAELLHVAFQGSDVCVWVRVAPCAVMETEIRRLYVAVTGQAVEAGDTHVGSCLTPDGAFVWHVFEASA